MTIYSKQDKSTDEIHGIITLLWSYQTPKLKLLQTPNKTY